MITDYKDGMDLSGFTGVVRGMPESVYFADDSLSQSSLKYWAQSLEDGVYGCQLDPKKSKAMTVGSAVHCLLLDGEDAFSQRYITGGPINKKTGKMYGRDTQTFQNWLADQPRGAVYISEEEMQSVELMAQSVLRDDFARSLVEMPGGERELSLFWQEEIGGVKIRCRGRIDWFNPAIGVVDCKTTNEVGPDGFARSITKYGWHIQCYWYGRGLVKTGLAPDHMSWGWLAIQSTPPHRIALYHPSDEIKGTGKVLAHKGLINYLRHAKTGEEFVQMSGFSAIDIPEWAKANEYEFNAATEVLG